VDKDVSIARRGHTSMLLAFWSLGMNLPGTGMDRNVHLN